MYRERYRETNRDRERYTTNAPCKLCKPKWHAYTRCVKAVRIPSKCRNPSDNSGLNWNPPKQQCPRSAPIHRV